MHEVMFGRHAYWFEPPDLVCCVIEGDIHVDEMRRMVGYIRARAEGCEHVLLLGDAARLGTIPADARKEFRGAMGIPYGGVAIYHASFHTRMLAIMILGALRLLNRTRFPFEFFATEAEARRWIEEQRAALAPAPPKDEVGS